MRCTVQVIEHIHSHMRESTNEKLLQRETKVFVQVVLVLQGKLLLYVLFHHYITGLSEWPTPSNAGKTWMVVSVSETLLYPVGLFGRVNSRHS